MLKGGGRAFEKTPRNFATGLPRKVREMGMRVALSVKLREHNLEVVPSLNWPSPKTNPFYRRIKTKGWAERTLFVLGAGDEIPRCLDLASRNLQGVDVMLAKDLTVYEALRWKRLVLDVDAVGYFAEKLAKEGVDAPEDSTAAIIFDQQAKSIHIPHTVNPSPVVQETAN